VLDALFQLIPTDLLSFFGLDSSEQADLFMQDFPAEEPGGDDDGAAFWVHYWDCAPCCYPDRSGDVRSITKLSDFYSARQWHATGMYHDCFGAATRVAAAAGGGQCRARLWLPGHRGCPQPPAARRGPASRAGQSAFGQHHGAAHGRGLRDGRKAAGDV
jgi:hypothetical protein